MVKRSSNYCWSYLGDSTGPPPLGSVTCITSWERCLESKPELPGSAGQMREGSGHREGGYRGQVESRANLPPGSRVSLSFRSASVGGANVRRRGSVWDILLDEACTPLERCRPPRRGSAAGVLGFLSVNRYWDREGRVLPT